jgi:hypothetical protein
MVRRNYIEPYEITLARWVKKALNQTFIRKKSYKGSKLQEFAHLSLGLWIIK